MLPCNCWMDGLVGVFFFSCMRPFAASLRITCRRQAICQYCLMHMACLPALFALDGCQVSNVCFQWLASEHKQDMSNTEMQELTVRSPRLHCLPILVGIPHKVGVSPCPPLHASGIQAHSSLLIKLLKVLGVQGMLDSGLMWSLSTVEIIPINAIKERMALQIQSLGYLSCSTTAYSVIACPHTSMHTCHVACILVIWQLL